MTLRKVGPLADTPGPLTTVADKVNQSVLGPAGPAGADGASVKGDKGDLGNTGEAGATGSSGASGVDGKTLRSGSGVPSGGLGADGDFYINTAANTIYGPKTSGAWGSSTSMVGPTGSTGSSGSSGASGADGRTIYSGSGSPSGGTGVNGDLYSDTTAKAIYVKAAGSWGSAISLVGATGSAGSVGSTGATGPGVPNGGAKNGILTKLSTSNQDTVWAVSSGAAPTMGSATLVLGNATVSTTAVTASSLIFLSVNSTGVLGNLGGVYVLSVTAGTGFAIRSTNLLSTATVAWLIVDPS